jgi:uncharacterized protein YodC (DUF2158 family)
LAVAEPMRPANDMMIDVEWFDRAEVRRDVFHRDCLTTEKPNG